MAEILLGTTDRTVTVFIPDPASTDGSGKTGLTHTSFTVSYTRVETDNDVVVTDVTSSLSTLSALTDAHTDWGLKEVSSTLAPGLYRLDIADAVFASGAWEAVVYVMITSSAAAATPMKFDLVAFNPLDSVRLGLTALPNAAAEAAGGLYTRGSGAGQINQNANGQIDARGVALSNDVITAAATASDFGTEIGTAVWATAARTVTAATNITSTGAAVPITAGGLVSSDVTAISTSTTAADNAEVVYATDFATNYDTTLDRWQVDVDMISTSATAANNLEVVFDTDFATNYSTSNDMWQVNSTRIGNSTTVVTNMIAVYSTQFATNYNTTDQGWNVNVARIEGADPTDTIRDSVVDDATRIDASALNTASATTIPAIVAKTNSLTFTVANNLDANIQYVNDVQVTGDGQTGSEWGP